MKNKKTILISLVILITIIIISLATIIFTDNTTSRKFLLTTSNILGTKDFDNVCTDLKSYQEVEEIISKNKLILDKEEIDLKNRIQKDPKDIMGNLCVGKAILVFDVETSYQAKEIKDTIGKSFYGVQYRINIM
jgi:hypothetical protein